MSNKTAEDWLKTVGKKVRGRRNMKGLTQTELAESIDGITLTTLAQIERGERNTTLTMLFKISDKLECQVSDFFK